MAERAGSEYPPPDSKPHRGWHQPHGLPHSDSPQIVQLLAFRLADTLPAHIFDHKETPGLMRRWVERDPDRGSGACCLARPEVTDLVQSALLVFEEQRYRQRAWCSMLNHVHVPFEASGGWRPADIVKSWKSHSGAGANRSIGRSGPFWQPDYFGRYLTSICVTRTRWRGRSIASNAIWYKLACVPSHHCGAGPVYPGKLGSGLWTRQLVLPPVK